eukprot:TRINITY_DN31039_c0_g1_i1.p1 TRINITY_DN31039_c0_g1~~TRINITY_DN31039_c0_g1_i1.p1  ORF type:complete len:683 (+),score=142.46 TRINITY_DN31039_c0_g1_i1:267-2051(+)
MLPASVVLDRLLHASAHREEHLQFFLDEVEWAAKVVGIEETDRSYRFSFTENYKALFAFAQRWYAAEVLRASLNFQEQMIVSGVIYDISLSACRKAAQLEQCFAELTDMLDSLARSSMLIFTSQIKPLLQRFNDALVNFEKEYITELIAIEVQARSPVVLAFELEMGLQEMERCDASCHDHKKTRSDVVKGSCLNARVHSGAGFLQLPEAESPRARPRLPSSPRLRLRQLSGAESPCSRQHRSLGEGSPCARQRELSGEMQHASLPSEQAAWPGKPCESQIRRLAASASSSRCKHSGIRVALEKLLAQVSTLNAYINVQGRGREDMNIEVLEAAADAFLNKAGDVHNSHDRGTLRASEAARRYLASNVLSSFADLRNYFAEAGKDILHIDPELGNNVALVQRLAAWEESWELGAQFLVKADMLASLCNVAAQTAEAQRYVPELESLVRDHDAEVFLILPRLVLLFGLAMPEYSALLVSLLPHLFGQSDSHTQQTSTNIWQSAGKQTADLISAFEHVNMSLGHCDTWHKEILVRRAVLGAGQGSCPNDTDRAVDRFMLQLEGFSMELQRHQPGDWNRCCSVLMQCISAASEAARC